ncbi:MAG TPA: Ku protein [Dehalococcoidia bacterium]|nr:Ku protein [Dehalococcoidia bacterium]
MPRSIWNGVISFGMVSIPVKLYTATEDKDISFNLLHKECGTRLKQLRWCPYHERAVEWSEIARGYEYAKDEYVVMTDEDFEKLPLPSKRTVELSAFVDAGQIDPIYYQRTYYLEPEEKGVKPYALLMKALREKGLTGIAKIAIRHKEQLCALRPMDGTLVIETLYYPDEIREVPSEIEDVKVTSAEMKMAEALIDLLQADFKPEEYKDEYREALQQVIDAKLEGQEIAEPKAARPAKVVDLMSALKASVAAAKKSRGAPAEEEEEERPARRRKKAAAAG